MIGREGDPEAFAVLWRLIALEPPGLCSFNRDDAGSKEHTDLL